MGFRTRSSLDCVPWNMGGSIPCVSDPIRFWSSGTGPEGFYGSRVPSNFMGFLNTDGNRLCRSRCLRGRSRAPDRAVSVARQHPGNNRFRPQRDAGSGLGAAGCFFVWPQRKSGDLYGCTRSDRHRYAEHQLWNQRCTATHTPCSAHHGCRRRKNFLARHRPGGDSEDRGWPQTGLGFRLESPHGRRAFNHLCSWNRTVAQRGSEEAGCRSNSGLHDDHCRNWNVR